MLMMERASLGLSTQPDDVPSPLTECLDILLHVYEASLPTGMLSIYMCIALSHKTQISSKFLF